MRRFERKIEAEKGGCPSTLLSHVLNGGNLAKLLDLPHLAFLLHNMDNKLTLVVGTELCYADQALSTGPGTVICN